MARQIFAFGCHARETAGQLQPHHAMALSIQRPFVSIGPSRTYGNEQALCGCSIGADSFLKVTD